MKHCAKCGQDLDNESFYYYKGKPFGYCKPCHATYSNTWWRRNKTARYAANKGWRDRNLDRRRQTFTAYNKVQWALKKGWLVRPTICERCSTKGKIEAAHGDYAKPLQVLWLCQSCHRTWDKKPKTKQRATCPWRRFD